MAASIDIVVGSLSHIFALFGLDINWKPGKTEAMLQARGPGSKQLITRYIHEDGIYVPVPVATGSSTTHKLFFVRRYKHLGRFIQAEGGLNSEARWRSQQALSAYAPMAYRVFGSSGINDWLKYLLLYSMILSRLLYMCHTVVPSVGFFC